MTQSDLAARLTQLESDMARLTAAIIALTSAVSAIGKGLWPEAAGIIDYSLDLVLEACQVEKPTNKTN